MARQDEAGDQEDFRLSWKYWIGLLVGWVVSNLLFDTLLPDLPPLWGALVIALLFGIFAIAFPLVLARNRRRNASATVLQPSPPNKH